MLKSVIKINLFIIFIFFYVKYIHFCFVRPVRNEIIVGCMRMCVYRPVLCP